jgi:uncharacterized protein YxjI
MDLSTLQAQQTLFVKQKFTLMVNRYEVWAADPAGNPTSMVAFAEQKRMAFKEQVTLFTDATKASVLAGFKARKVLDLGGAYDVTDANGTPIGLFRKDFAASLLRSTWHLEQPNQAPATVRNATWSSRCCAGSPTSASCRTTSTSFGAAPRCWRWRSNGGFGTSTSFPSRTRSWTGVW